MTEISRHQQASQRAETAGTCSKVLLVNPQRLQNHFQRLSFSRLKDLLVIGENFNDLRGFSHGWEKIFLRSKILILQSFKDIYMEMRKCDAKVSESQNSTFLDDLHPLYSFKGNT